MNKYIVKRKKDGRVLYGGSFYKIESINNYCGYDSLDACIKDMILYRLLDTSKYEICKKKIEIILSEVDNTKYKKAVQAFNKKELTRLKREYQRKLRKFKNESK